MSNELPKVTFKILEVNDARATRTQDYIRVEVFEDDESVGWWWQSPKLIKANIKRFGEDAYINLLEILKGISFRLLEHLQSYA